MSADETDEQWAEIGHHFAQDQLERHSVKLGVAYRKAAKAARDGTLSGDDLQRCFQALESAEYVIDEIADHLEGYDHPPRVEEMMNQD